jgi:hypothetical protein
MQVKQRLMKHVADQVHAGPIFFGVVTDDRNSLLTLWRKDRLLCDRRRTNRNGRHFSAMTKL